MRCCVNKYWILYRVLKNIMIKMNGKFARQTEMFFRIDIMAASSVYYRFLITAISDQSVKLTNQLIKKR